MWDEEMEGIKKVKPRESNNRDPSEDSEVKHLDWNQMCKDGKHWKWSMRFTHITLSPHFDQDII